MSNRTLVKLTASEYCVGFSTVSFRRRSPRTFLVTRSQLEKLEAEGAVIAQDIHCFAVFRRNTLAGTVSIEFAWLHSEMFKKLVGYEETVTLPYDAFMRFVRESQQEGGPSQWAALSVIDTRRPKLVFYDTAGLHKCVENRLVRKKLARFLRDHFQWTDADEIGFYRDFVPYSFLFREVCRGKPGIVGGVILHMQDDMKKAYYSLHT